MSSQADEIVAFWWSYLKSTGQSPENADESPEAWAFGDDPKMADDLGRMVADGIKTSTCSLLWEYDRNDEALPEEGDLSIILDGSGQPLCLVESTEVRIRAYDDVDARFAYDEGEGDRSLSYWRDAHWRFFGRVCRALGRTPSHTMPLVCERFRVIYKPS